jgi:hypothetical protein
MAIVTFNIPDNQPGRLTSAQLLDLFCANQGYTGLTPQGAAETKLQFLKRKTWEWWYQSTGAAEKQAVVTSFVPTAGPDIT